MRSYGKDRAKDKGFEFYFDGYPHDVFIANKGTVFAAKAKCSRSLQAREKPHNLTVDLRADDGTVLGGRWGGGETDPLSPPPLWIRKFRPMQYILQK